MLYSNLEYPLNNVYLVQTASCITNRTSSHRLGICSAHSKGRLGEIVISIPCIVSISVVRLYASLVCHTVSEQSYFHCLKLPYEDVSFCKTKKTKAGKKVIDAPRKFQTKRSKF
jgi:hypothetical protein